MPCWRRPHRGVLQDFELFCVFTALEQWSAQATPGRLFVNISADALVHGVGMVGMAKLGEAVRSCGLNARMLVLEITEHERVTNMPCCAKPLTRCTPAAPHGAR